MPMSSTDPRSTPTPDDGADVEPTTQVPAAEGDADPTPAPTTDEPDVDPIEELFDDEAYLDDARLGDPGLAVRAGAEAAGSFILVLATLGVVLYTGISGVGALGAALAGGLALAAVVSTFGHVSGGGFIPA